MPRLPSAESLGQRPEVRTSGGTVAYRATSGQEEAPALAQLKLGQTISAAGEDIYGAQKRYEAKLKVEQEKQDTIRAEEAYNTLREKQLDLTIGEKNGFVNRKGADAVTKPLFNEYGGMLDQAVKDVESTLSTDGQREKFKMRAAVAGREFKQDLLRHITAQNDAYARTTTTATLDIEARQAVAKFNDPAAIELAVARSNAAIDRQAAKEGSSAEVVADAKLKQASRIYGDVVKQMLAGGDYVGANKYFQEKKDFIDEATAAKVQHAVVDGTQKQLANGYRTEYLATQNNYKGLDGLKNRILADKTLDDARRNSLIAPIQGQMATLERRAEVAQNRREKQVERMIDLERADTLAGFPSADPKRAAAMLSAARGTPYEGEARTAVAMAAAVSQFSKAPPNAQAEEITRVELAVRNNPSGDSRRYLNALKTIQTNQRTEAVNDPTNFVVRQGWIDPADPAAQPIDWSKPGAAVPQIAARVALAQDVSRQLTVPNKPLREAELAPLVAGLKVLPANQKGNWFGQLYQATEGVPGAYRAVISQIAPDSPVLAIAGARAGRGGPAALRDSETILRGEEILNPPAKEDGKPSDGKLVTMPPEKEFRREWDSKVAGAFSNPRAADAHYQAAMAAYAALSFDDRGKTPSDTYDSRRWNRAIEIALGGKVESYRGRQIIMPEVPAGRFKDELYARIGDIAVSGRLGPTVTADRLKDLPLAPAGDNRYVFMAGDAVLTDKDGRDIVVDFNAAPSIPTAVTEPTGRATMTDVTRRRSGDKRTQP